MKIDAVREGGSARVKLEGRLDREWAEHLSDTLQDLLQDGVRTLSLDFAGVTYVSSEAAKVLTRWHQELALLRGDLRLTDLSPVVRNEFALSGWDADVGMPDRPGTVSGGIRRSYWHSRTDLAASGHYEVSACSPAGTLTCHLFGDPEQLTRGPLTSGDCCSVSLTEDTFALGVGAIGRSYGDCRDRMGELLAVAGCVAYFPSDGARMADYLVAAGDTGPRAVMASGMSCRGGFTKLVRFNKQPEADAIPLSELASIALDAVGGTTAGLVVAGETAGLAGVRLRRSPAHERAPVRFEVPAIRDWLSFAPERTHAMTTTVIAGVVARHPVAPLASYLRPLDSLGDLFGHFHAAVFSYHPLPQRTVDLTGLLRGLFANHQLRDVLHLVWDDRGETGVGESQLLRGVGWVAPITELA